MSGIPEDIKKAIVDSCTKFGTTTLGFSYAFFGLIVAIALIVMAAYKIISWILCLVLIIAMVIVMILFVMLYQYVVGQSISNGLNSIKLPNILDYITGKIPTIPPIPPIGGNKPILPVNPIKPTVEELSESLEE